MISRLTLFLLVGSFLLGAIYGGQILEKVYSTIGESLSFLFGKPVIISNQDYIRFIYDPTNDTIYLFVEIEKPASFNIAIPQNNTTLEYYYNVSEYVDVYVSGKKWDFIVLINNKLPVYP